MTEEGLEPQPRRRFYGSVVKDPTTGIVVSGGGSNTDTMLLEANEKILAQISSFYSGRDNDFGLGLSKIGAMISHTIPIPRRKITVLLLGNHSAGKSSFINWYIQQSVLKTSVAIETQGFTFVTAGKKAEQLKGAATLRLYPHLKPLEQFPGVIDYLTTEITTARARKFKMVTFVDTPGLVDGDMEYPFDVNEALLWLGKMADLVFVFFDPMGQALCKRTLSIVEKMWAGHSEKMRLYLAKADEAGTETDRQKVLMQIVQELCKRPGLNRTGFAMPTIFITDMSDQKVARCGNQINEACEEISKCIEHTVQNSLNTLESDLTFLKERIDEIINSDLVARARNRAKKIRSRSFGMLGMFFPLMFFACFVCNQMATSPSSVRGEMYLYFKRSLTLFLYVWNGLDEDYVLPFITAVVIFSGICLMGAKCCILERVLRDRDLKGFQRAADVVNETIERKKEMYSMYLKQSVSEEDYGE